MTTPPKPSLPARQDGPRKVARNGGPQGGLQTEMTMRTNKTGKKLLSDGVHEDKMLAWSDKVLAAEAKKAGSGNEATRRIPRPQWESGLLMMSLQLGVWTVLIIIIVVVVVVAAVVVAQRDHQHRFLEEYLTTL